MKKFILVVFLFIFPMFAFAQTNINRGEETENCIEKTFYALREQDRKTNCGMPTAETAANFKCEGDLGIRFSGCKVVIAYGDAEQSFYYSKKNSLITLLPDNGPNGPKFTLSENEDILTSINDPKEIYKVKAKPDRCLEETFYAGRAEDRNISCSRGHDCSKAKDAGLKFSKCEMHYWKGDAGMIINYEIKDNIISFLARYPSQESKFFKNKYILSDDGTTIINSNDPEETYKSKCKICKDQN